MNRSMGVTSRWVVTVSLLVPWTAVLLGAGPTPGAGANGEKIAFEGDHFGDWGLSAMKPDGKGITKLHAPPGAADASWSPDGERVAFEMDPQGDGNLEIFVMSAKGKDVRQLTESPARDLWPDWFPDGQRIAFTSERNGLPNLYVMNADGSDEQPLTDALDSASREPAVSPDGQQVAFWRETPFAPPTIWVLNVDGSGETQLTLPGPYADMSPQWSPDGETIVFASDRTGAFEIYAMDADGENLVQLTDSPDADFSPTFSPDGQRIAWWQDLGPHSDVWTMNADGTGQVNVTNSPAFEGFPDWRQGHPAGKH